MTTHQCANGISTHIGTREDCPICKEVWRARKFGSGSVIERYKPRRNSREITKSWTYLGDSE